MRRAYLRTQFRRTLRALPAVLLLVLSLAGAAAALFGAFLRTDAASEEKRLVTVGVVGDGEDSYLGFSFAALSSLDSSRFSVRFVATERTAAERQLKSGELDGYFLIPEGFVDSIVDGSNLPIVFRIRESTDAMGTLLMRDLTKILSALITESQSAIFGFEQLAQGVAPAEAETLANRLNLEYISTILTRENASTVELLGLSDGLGVLPYYFCAVVLIFLLSLGLSCCFLFVRGDWALPRLLAARGTRAAAQVLCEWTCCFFLFVLALAFLLLPAGLLLSAVGGGETVTPDSLFRLFVGAIPAVAALAALQLFLFECCSGLLSAVLLSFAAGIGSAYLSGCFYPSYFFPATLQRFAALTPAGATFAQLRQSLSGQAMARPLLLLLLWFAVFLCLTVAVRRARIRGGKA